MDKGRHAHEASAVDVKNDLLRRFLLRAKEPLDASDKMIEFIINAIGSVILVRVGEFLLLIKYGIVFSGNVSGSVDPYPNTFFVGFFQVEV